MNNARKIEILEEARWRLENIFLFFTDNIEDATDNQFKAWDIFVPLVEKWMDEFSADDFSTNEVAIYLSEILYPDIDRIREGKLSDGTYGLYLEATCDNEKVELRTWVNEYWVESLFDIYPLLEKLYEEEKISANTDPKNWYIN